MSKKRYLSLAVFFLVATLMFGGCGGGGGGGGEPEPPTPTPPPTVLEIPEDNILLEDPVYNDRLRAVTAEEIVSLLFRDDNTQEKDYGLAPSEATLSNGTFVPGDVWVVAPSKDSLRGFGAVVEEVKENSNNTWTYSLRQAQMNDVLRDGKLFVSLNSTPSSFVGEEDSGDVIFGTSSSTKSNPLFDDLWTAFINGRADTVLPVDVELPSLSIGIGGDFSLNIAEHLQAGVSAEYSAGMRWGISFLFAFSDYFPVNLGVAMPYEVTNEFSLGVSGKVTMSKTVPYTPDIPIWGVWFGVPTPFFGIPLPVYVGSTGKGVLECVVDVGGNYSYASSGGFSGMRGFAWDTDKGFSQIESRADNGYPSGNPPPEHDVELEGKFEVGSGCDIDLNIYGLKFVKLPFRLGPSLSGTLKDNGEACLTLDLFARGGVEVNLLGVFGLDWLTCSFTAEATLNIFDFCSPAVDGYVKNAVNGEKIPGAKVVFFSSDTSTGETAFEDVTTDANGNFVLEKLQSGKYAVTASAEGFVTLKEEIEIDKRARIPVALNLSPDDDNIARIVLGWGVNPYDLDAHLTGPRSDGSRFHIYYRNMSGGGDSGADLDIDDRYSYGPETITMRALHPGIYRYSVHDYTNRNSSSNSELTNSGAHVEVYFNNGKRKSYQVPGGLGTLWTVFEFEVDSNKKAVIREIKGMGSQSDPAIIQSLRQTK